MQNVPEWMWDVWEAGQFVGDNRPNTRASISKRTLAPHGMFRKLLFNRLIEEHEIPNIITVDIDRRLGADAAQMTMVLANTLSASTSENLDESYNSDSPYSEPGDAVAPTKRELHEFGSPGYYSFGRGLVVGDDDETNPWGHNVDPVWVNMFAPNRIVKTFQGYGTDGAGKPSNDTRLVLTGVWMIDKVDFSADGSITLSCRDTAKLLIEQRLYPPIVPLDEYPLEFSVDRWETVDQPPVVVPTPEVIDPILGVNVGAHVADGVASPNWDSSTAPWYGWNAPIYGHRASDAFSSDTTMYWLSPGAATPDSTFSYGWIDADCGGEPVNRVSVKPWKGGYVCYVSVMEDGVWQGAETIPYDPLTVGRIQADKPYVMKLTLPAGEGVTDIDLPATYNADFVRVTFTNLQNSGLGTYPYRCGVYQFEVRHATQEYVVPPVYDPPTEGYSDIFIPGNITDYTDIVKLFAAWAGFYWPLASDYDPLLEDWGAVMSDSDWSGGRVWGDFMYSGAYPVDEIEPSYWDNKSVMDGINQIKEILGFIMYVDHTGGIVWRPPNIWKTGNFVSGAGYIDESSVRLIDEEKVLFDYGVTLSDESLRSEVIAVSSADPSVYGAFSPGFSSGETFDYNKDNVANEGELISDLALLAGQQRVMLIANYPFGEGTEEPTFLARAKAELEKFAYLTSLWIHWSVRTSKFRIPGTPGFMPDDQVRIYERTTSESFIHYLQGVKSTMNLDTGTWYMDIDTHWLGNGPDSQWMVNFLDMPPALAAYLVAIGQVDGDSDSTPLPDDFFDLPIPDVPTDPIRVDGDFSDLFDLPPIPVWPPAEFDFESDYPPFITDPDYGNDYAGTSYNASNTFMWSHWGSQYLPTVKMRFLSAWRSVYDILPAEDIPWNTHPNQTADIDINIDHRAWGAFRALAELIVEKEYRVTSMGSHNDRRIKLVSCAWGTTWSNHSWGTAVDINPGAFPHGRRIYSGTMYDIGVEAVDRIRTGNGNHVFQWGNPWSSPDPMHFQVGATPSDLATGVSLTSGS